MKNNSLFLKESQAGNKKKKEEEEEEKKPQILSLLCPILWFLMIAACCPESFAKALPRSRPLRSPRQPTFRKEILKRAIC